MIRLFFFALEAIFPYNRVSLPLFMLEREKKVTDNTHRFLEKTYAEYREKLCIHAANLLCDDEGAKDVVNDVFCALFESPDRLDEKKDPLPMLYTAVRNRCIDYLRHKQVIRKNEKSYIEELFGNFSAADYREYERKIERMQEEIERLPPQMRTVLEAFFLKKKSYKEIGEELDISPHTARTHIVRALTVLRRTLKMLFLYSNLSFVCLIDRLIRHLS